MRLFVFHVYLIGFVVLFVVALCAVMILYNGDFYVYMDLYIFSLNGRLYRPPRYFFTETYLLGLSIIHIMLHGHRLIMNRSVYNSVLVYRISCGIQAYFLEIAAWDHEMQLFSHKLLVVQRAVRAWLARRSAERRLAVVMAAHARLGEASGLGGLGLDLVDACACLVSWVPGKVAPSVQPDWRCVARELQPVNF